MTCDQARDELLIADPRDLAVDGGDLANHLSACAECRARADALVAQTALLASTVRRRARSRRSRRVFVIASLPIAAAALIAVAVRSSHETSIARTTVARSASPLPVAKHVSLTVAPGQSAAVLRTADSTVTVIWITGAGQ
jgi:hypothetical protein